MSQCAMQNNVRPKAKCFWGRKKEKQLVVGWNREGKGGREEGKKEGKIRGRARMAGERERERERAEGEEEEEEKRGNKGWTGGVPRGFCDGWCGMTRPSMTVLFGGDTWLLYDYWWWWFFLSLHILRVERCELWLESIQFRILILGKTWKMKAERIG